MTQQRLLKNYEIILTDYKIISQMENKSQQR